MYKTAIHSNPLKKTEFGNKIPHDGHLRREGVGQKERNGIGKQMYVMVLIILTGLLCIYYACVC